MNPIKYIEAYQAEVSCLNLIGRETNPKVVAVVFEIKTKVRKGDVLLFRGDAIRVTKVLERRENVKWNSRLVYPCLWTTSRVLFETLETSTGVGGINVYDKVIKRAYSVRGHDYDVKITV